MILYANGCSMMLGSELGEEDSHNRPLDVEYRAKHCSVGVLADLLNADEVVNDSCGGGSNDRIVRTTIDWVLANKDRDDILVIIGWTEPSRRELYLQDIRLHHNWATEEEYPFTQTMYHDPDSDIGKSKLGKLTEHYLMNHRCEIVDIYQYLQQIILLREFLKSNNIPHLFFSGLSSIDIYFNTAMYELDKDADYKDKFGNTLWNGSGNYKEKLERLYENVVYDNSYFTRGMYVTTQKHSKQMKPRGHPDESGHLFWGRKLYTTMKDRGII